MFKGSSRPSMHWMRAMRRRLSAVRLRSHEQRRALSSGWRGVNRQRNRGSATLLAGSSGDDTIPPPLGIHCRPPPALPFPSSQCRPIRKSTLLPPSPTASAMSPTRRLGASTRSPRVGCGGWGSATSAPGKGSTAVSTAHEAGGLRGAERSRAKCAMASAQRG